MHAVIGELYLNGKRFGALLEVEFPHARNIGTDEQPKWERDIRCLIKPYNTTSEPAAEETNPDDIVAEDEIVEVKAAVFKTKRNRAVTFTSVGPMVVETLLEQGADTRVIYVYENKENHQKKLDERASYFEAWYNTLKTFDYETIPTELQNFMKQYSKENKND